LALVAGDNQGSTQSKQQAARFGVAAISNFFKQRDVCHGERKGKTNL
jgi:hypothetical protein